MPAGPTYSNALKVVHKMRVKFDISTSGNGFWSKAIRSVRVNRLEIAYVDEEGEHAELRAYFTKNSWNTLEHGLIYTDQRFMREIRAQLTHIGLPGGGVDYTEQGMQGDDYVSFDCGKRFINAWEKLGEQISGSDHRDPIPVKIKSKVLKPEPTVIVNDPVDRIMQVIRGMSDRDRLRLIERMVS